MNNKMPIVLVTGSNGQLGTALRNSPFAKLAKVHFLPRNVLDVRDNEAIQCMIEKHRPNVIVNAAAYTAVDLAETEMEQALLANYKGAENLAVACRTHNVKLIQLSTDYVFDGKGNIPYQETEHTNPINFYGESKWQGEQAVRQHCEQHIILRISGVFSTNGNNFLKTILRLAQEKEELSIVYDQITCPTFAGDIADTIFKLIQNSSIYGTYHYCSHDPVSWYDFASQIIAAAKHNQILKLKILKPVLASEYKTKAIRPAYSVLDCSKLKKDTGILQPSWQQAIQNLAKQD